MRKSTLVLAILGVLSVQASCDYPEHNLADTRESFDRPDNYGALKHHIVGDDRKEKAVLPTIDKQIGLENLQNH
jgi:hypothetical protein